MYMCAYKDARVTYANRVQACVDHETRETLVWKSSAFWAHIGNMRAFANLSVSLLLFVYIYIYIAYIYYICMFTSKPITYPVPASHLACQPTSQPSSQPGQPSFPDNRPTGPPSLPPTEGDFIDAKMEMKGSPRACTRASSCGAPFRFYIIARVSYLSKPLRTLVDFQKTFSETSRRDVANLLSPFALSQ